MAFSDPLRPEVPDAVRELQRAGVRVTMITGDQPATLYIPAGVAHGFLAMTAVDLIYWVTREYDATDEYGIAWNDPTLGIRWRTERPVVSERDRQNPDLEWDSIPSFS